MYGRKTYAQHGDQPFVLQRFRGDGPPLCQQQQQQAHEDLRANAKALGNGMGQWVPQSIVGVNGVMQQLEKRRKPEAAQARHEQPVDRRQSI